MHPFGCPLAADGPTASSQRYLIAGLGNPGARYAGNRHNVGVQCVRKLAEECHLCIDRRRKRVLYGLGEASGRTVILAQPRTFMNQSGLAVTPLVRFYQVPLCRLLVVYDDLDLPLGTVRIRPGGGSGGHKGIRSIIHHLGGDSSFPRLRIGIGRPPGKMEPSAYVLQDFRRDEVPVVGEVLDRSVAAIGAWLRDGIDAAMNGFN